MPFVIDNSISSGWFIRNQATPYSETIAVRLQDDRAVAPPIWELEFANVLRTACLRKALTAQTAQEVAARIASLPIDVDRQAVRPAELLSLALRYGLTSYDAAYLELALRRQLPIATLDAALCEAAMACGVGVVPEEG
jgi:predicted nucleic acid-binding protein